MSGWRRFVRASSEGGRFWAIRTVGSVCELRFGASAGDSATLERIEHDSEAAARRTAKQKIRNKVRAGWIEVDLTAKPRPELGSTEAIERALAEDPTNLDNWAVYADLLQSIEPLLGERVALGLAATRGSHDRGQIDARIATLEREHGRALFGARLDQILGDRRLAGIVGLERRFGMIVGARFHNSNAAVPKIDAVIAALLELPVARLLTELFVETRVRHPSYATIVETLVARPRPQLRRLSLGDEPIHAVATRRPMPPLAAVLDAAPLLERLELHGAFYGSADHERLRALELRRPKHDVGVELPRYRLPELEILHVYETGPIDWANVELPRLRHLVVEWSNRCEHLLRGLARAPRLLAQLETLTIHQSNLRDRDAEVLLANADAFSGPRSLRLVDVLTSAERTRELHALLPNLLEFDPTTPDDDDDLGPEQRQILERLRS